MPGDPASPGTSLRVTGVAIAHLFHERTPGQLASDYGLTLAQVHAALAFTTIRSPSKKTSASNSPRRGPIGSNALAVGI